MKKSDILEEYKKYLKALSIQLKWVGYRGLHDNLSLMDITEGDAISFYGFCMFRQPIVVSNRLVTIFYYESGLWGSSQFLTDHKLISYDSLYKEFIGKRYELTPKDTNEPN